MTLPDRALCQQRLATIFAEGTPGRGRLTNQLASAAVFVCLFAGAVGERRRIRPSMVLWMCDEAAAGTSGPEREAWYVAARAGKRALVALLQEWGIEHRPWYADNTREPLRDETFRAWAELGAALRDESVPTTSSLPQWSLSADFAALFATDLDGPELDERVADWQEDNLGTLGRTRIAVARRLANVSDQVMVTLTDGTVRSLAAGPSSQILKSVIEDLAPRLMQTPAVLFISESRRHLDVVDRELLERLGIALDTGRLLPDALLFDLELQIFWFVEAVHSDGPIDEGRKQALTEWAVSQGIPIDHCRYLTAFASRTSPAFRRLAARLAWGTSAWFLDEPENILRLGAVGL